MIQNLRNLTLFLLVMVLNITMASTGTIHVKSIQEEENGAILVALGFEGLLQPLTLESAQFTDKTWFIQLTGWGHLETIDRTGNLIKATNPLIKEMMVRNNYKGDVYLNVETLQSAAYFIVQRENLLIISIQPMLQESDQFSMIMNQQSDDKIVMELARSSPINLLGQLDAIAGKITVIAQQFPVEEWIKAYFLHRDVQLTPYRDLVLLSTKSLDLTVLQPNIANGDDKISIHFPLQTSELILSILSDYSDQIIYRNGDSIKVVTAVKDVPWVQVLEGIAILNHQQIYAMDYALIVDDALAVENDINQGCFRAPLWLDIYKYRGSYEWINFNGNPEEILKSVNKMLLEIEQNQGCDNIQILQRYHNLRNNDDGSYSIRILAIPFLLERFEALSKSMQNGR